MKALTRRGMTVAALVALGGVTSTGAALAFWQVTAEGDATAAAGALPTAPTPTVTLAAPNERSTTVTATGAGAPGWQDPTYVARAYPLDQQTATTTPVSCAGGATPTCNDTLPSDGMWEYALQAVIAGSDWTGPASQRTPVLVDTTAPRTIMTSPTSAWRSDATGVAPELTASDANGNLSVAGVRSVTWTRSGAAGTGTATISATAGATKTFTMPTVTTDGTTTFSYVVRDDRGNAADPVLQTIRLERSAPAVTASAPTSTNRRPTITGTGGTATETADRSADAATVSVTLTSGSTVHSATPAITSTGSWSYTPPSDLPFGSYTVAVAQRDAAGNVGTSSASGAVTDETAPTAPTITDPKNGENYYSTGSSTTGSCKQNTCLVWPTITGQPGTDTGSGVARVEAQVSYAVTTTGPNKTTTTYYWNGTQFTTAVAWLTGGTGWSLVVPTSALTAGTDYRITARTVDNAGNVSTSNPAVTATYKG